MFSFTVMFLYVFNKVSQHGVLLYLPICLLPAFLAVTSLLTGRDKVERGAQKRLTFEEWNTIKDTSAVGMVVEEDGLLVGQVVFLGMISRGSETGNVATSFLLPLFPVGALILLGYPMALGVGLLVLLTPISVGLGAVNTKLARGYKNARVKLDEFLNEDDDTDDLTETAKDGEL
jgi:hypothetical protein